MTPLGCGGAVEEGFAAEYQSKSEVLAVSAPPTIPREIEEQLKECVKRHGREFKTYSHTIHFMIGMTDEGVASDVILEKSTLPSDELESCMAHAFVGLSIPPSAMVARSSRPISGGEWLPESRGPLGIVQAVAGVALLPIVVIAVGVTVAVYATATTIEAVEKWRRIEKLCMPWLLQCLADKDQPNWNIDDFGTKKDCQSCFEECKHDKGVWPDYKCPRPGYRPPGKHSN